MIVAAVAAVSIFYAAVAWGMKEWIPLSVCPIHMYGCSFCLFSYFAMLSCSAVGTSRRWLVLLVLPNFFSRGFVASALLRVSQGWLIPLIKEQSEVFIWRLSLLSSSLTELFVISSLTVIGVGFEPSSNEKLGKKPMRYGRYIAENVSEFVSFGILTEGGLVIADEMMGSHSILKAGIGPWLSIIRICAVSSTCALYAKWGATCPAFMAALICGTLSLTTYMLYTRAFAPYYSSTCSVIVAVLQLLVA